MKRRGGYKKATIDWWTQKMWKLYAHKDRKRTLDQVWLSSVEYASKIAEDIRKGALRDLSLHLAHFFAWISSFIAKCNNDENIQVIFRYDDKFSDIIAFKYPAVCGICKNHTCTCGLSINVIETVQGKKPSYKQLLELRKNFLEEHKYHQKDLDQWIKMFDAIYGNTIQGLPLEHIAFHFMEEVGEVADALTTIHERVHKFQNMDEFRSINNAVKKYESKDISPELQEALDLKLTLAIEIADSFSWWCSLYLKLSKIVEEVKGSIIKEKSANALIQNVYKINTARKLICPNCKKDHCDCDIFE